MSILQLRIRPGGAWVAVDSAVTLSSVPELAALFGNVTPRGHGGKLLALPHLDAVIAFQGMAGFFYLLAARCLGPFADFDHLRQCMPALIEATRDDVSTFLREKGWRPLDVDLRQRVALVGFSRDRNCFEGWRFELWEYFDGRVKVERLPSDRDCVSPCDDALLDVLDLSTFDGMAACARRQLEIRDPDQPASGSDCGGRLIAAQLTRGRISISVVCELGRRVAPVPPDLEHAVPHAPPERPALWRVESAENTALKKTWETRDAGT